jgi:hypothetical protein
MNLKTLAIAAALAFVPGIGLADNNEFVSQPVAYPIDQEVPAKGCDEAIRDAQFLRELQKTDGDVNPDMPATPECEQEKRTA